jgi:hypothetical protein
MVISATEANTMEAILATGHMIDAPDRAVPRFPASEEARVAGAVRRALEEWEVDDATTLVCGGARGADIIAAEAALERGAAVVVCLALPVDEFVQASVVLDGDPSWVDRFNAVLERSELLQPPEGYEAAGEGVFAHNNSRMIALATEIGGGRPYVLAVWNGRDGDGPGGTADIVRRCDATDSDRCRIIDPTPAEAVH